MCLRMDPAPTRTAGPAAVLNGLETVWNGGTAKSSGGPQTEMVRGKNYICVGQINEARKNC